MINYLFPDINTVAIIHVSHVLHMYQHWLSCGTVMFP